MIGIVIGVLASVCLVVVAIVYIRKRQGQKKGMGTRMKLKVMFYHIVGYFHVVTAFASFTDGDNGQQQQ